MNNQTTYRNITRKQKWERWDLIKKGSDIEITYVIVKVSLGYEPFDEATALFTGIMTDLDNLKSAIKEYAAYDYAESHYNIIVSFKLA